MKPSRLMSSLRGLVETLTLKFFGLIGPRLFSQRYFEYRYRRRTDPWSYGSSPYEQRKYQHTLAILPRAQYRSILEVGCSIGVFTEQLAERAIAHQIVGIDVAQNALERAKKRLERFDHVELRCLDITRDSLAGSFDLIFCAEVLYYLGTKNVEIVLDKLLKALADRGHLVLVHPWPLSQQLHKRFLERRAWQLLAEHIERDSERPYAIALYQKPVASTARGH